MALPTESSSQKDKPSQHRRKQKQAKVTKQLSSWDQIKNLLTCKQTQGSTVHDPSKIINPTIGCSKLGSSCASMCSFKDVVHGNTRVVHRADYSPESSTVDLLQRRQPVLGSSSHRGLRSNGGRSNYTSPSSSKGMQFRKLSGCHECHTIADPSKYPYSPRTTLCSCPHCGEVFPKIETLELHQKVRHAVSELGQEDSGRNIVEIIFKSSWLKNDSPICEIERILKVHNTQRTIQRFEDCRDAVKTHALAGDRKHPRCAADGNELLRFHCTTLSCSLGEHGSSGLCSSVPGCGVCTVIRRGFQADHSKGVRTTARSGAAHDTLASMDCRRAMLVCRVIAGRVRRVADDTTAAAADGACQTYDSVAGNAGIYTNLEELMVYNPKAILPCFVVIYRALAA